jgi:hypothetical protein
MNMRLTLFYKDFSSHLHSSLMFLFNFAWQACYRVPWILSTLSLVFDVRVQFMMNVQVDQVEILLRM